MYCMKSKIKNRVNLLRKLSRTDKLPKLILSEQLVNSLRQENEIIDINIEKNR